LQSPCSLFCRRLHSAYQSTHLGHKNLKSSLLQEIYNPSIYLIIWCGRIELGRLVKVHKLSWLVVRQSVPEHRRVRSSKEADIEAIYKILPSFAQEWLEPFSVTDDITIFSIDLLTYSIYGLSKTHLLEFDDCVAFLTKTSKRNAENRQKNLQMVTRCVSNFHFKHGPASQLTN